MGRKSNVTAPTLTIVDSANSHDASPSTTPMRPTPLIGSWGDYEWGMDHKVAVMQSAQQNAEKKATPAPEPISEPDHMVLARTNTKEYLHEEPKPVAAKPAEPAQPAQQQAAAPFSPITGFPEQRSSQQQQQFLSQSSGGEMTPESFTPQTQSYNEHYHHDVYAQQPPMMHAPQQHQQQTRIVPAMRVGHSQQTPSVSGFKPLRAYVPQQRTVIEGAPSVQVGGFDNHSHHNRQMVPPAAPAQRAYHPNVNVQQRNLPARQIHSHQQAQQQPQQRQQTQQLPKPTVPAGPVQVSKFAPPPPPGARCDAVFMRDGSPDDAFYTIVMRWYERAVISQEAHQGVPACPPAEEYLHDFPGWLEEVDKWWKANFANRKGRPSRQQH